MTLYKEKNVCRGSKVATQGSRSVAVVTNSYLHNCVDLSVLNEGGATPIDKPILEYPFQLHKLAQKSLHFYTVLTPRLEHKYAQVSKTAIYSVATIRMQPARR